MRGDDVPSTEGSSRGSMCEDAHPFCCTNLCVNECKCDSMNVKQTPKTEISRRELNKEKQLTDNIDKISSSPGNDSVNQLKSNQPSEQEEMTKNDKGQNDGMNQATDQSIAPRYSLRGGKRYPSVEEKM